MKLDKFDCKILNLLQNDGRIPTVKLANEVFLSPTAVHARVQKLENEGIINSYRAILSPDKIGLGMMLFVEVSLDRTSSQSIIDFNAAVYAHDEICECHMISGGFDYLLKIRVADMAAYREFSGRVLWSLPGVRETKTYAVMEEVKLTTCLPIDSL